MEDTAAAGLAALGRIRPLVFGGAVWNIFIALFLRLGHRQSQLWWQLARQLERFRVTVRIILPTLIITGFIQAYRYVGLNVGALIASPFGWLITIKLILIGIPRRRLSNLPNVARLFAHLGHNVSSMNCMLRSMNDGRQRCARNKTLNNRGSDFRNSGFLKLLEMFDGLAEGERCASRARIQSRSGSAVGRSRRHEIWRLKPRGRFGAVNSIT